MTGEAPLTFTYEYLYDALDYITYPNGFWIQNNQDGFGNTLGISLDDGTNVWYLDSSDGQDDLIKLGGTLNYADDPYADDPDMQNDPIYSFYSQEYFDVPDPVMTRSVHRDNKGFPASYTLNCGNTTISQLTFSHDPITGNLLSRSGMISQQETFSYDNLDRLTGVTAGNTPTMAIQYDDNGNIASKTGLGNYYYPSSSTRPHAVTAVDNTSALVSSSSQQVTYNALGKVATITEGAYTMEFTYGPDEQRWKSVLKHNGVIVRKTLYAGNYERVIEGSTTRHYCYLEGGAVNISEGNDDGTTYIMVTDNLGSIIKLVDIDGNTDFAASYDAWGRQTVASGNAISFHRGYTGHEMMPEFGLINMNGRLYDPILGRFLSPDNYIQMPDFSQSFNRYSYCLNNPLKYTDPDGEIAWFIPVAIIGGVINVALNAENIDDIGDFLGYFAVGGVASVAGVATGGLIGAGGVLGGAAAGFLGGAASGFILGSGNSIVANGWDMSAAFKAGFDGMIVSALSGALIGGIAGGYAAYKQGNNIWTGKPNYTPQIELDYEMMDELAPKIQDSSLNNASQSNSLTHYTTEKGYHQIMESEKLNPSIGLKNARYGEGQYLTNLDAKDYTAGQISRRLYGVPWNTPKVEYFIKINVNGLNVIQNNSYNFLIPGKNPLNLHGRIIDGGISLFKIKF